MQEKEKSNLVVNHNMHKLLSLALSVGVVLAQQKGNGNGNGRQVQKANGPKIAGCYGVTFTKEASVNDIESVKGRAKGRQNREWSNGVQVCGVSEAEMTTLLADSAVEEIFEDGLAFRSASTTLWGLDAVDGVPNNNDYSPPNGNNGAGTYVYVLDMCSEVSHPDFGGRAEFIAAADQYAGQGTTGACCDHGTHCMGSVGGNTYGVAKQAILKSVRVLDCNGSGAFTAIIAAMDWVRLNHATRYGSARAVISMSLGGAGVVSSIATAINNVRSAGIPVVVAAGNENVDACTTSPAYVPSAITVGAATSTFSLASFSNWGTCVDINAPGANICSTVPGNSFACWDGTSMATPHVAGAFAVLFSNQPGLSASQAEAVIINSAKAWISTTKVGHTNKFLTVDQAGSVCAVSNCQTCPVSSSQCTQCNTGFRLASSTSCVQCPAGCNNCDTSASVCDVCASGLTLIAGACITCPTNCATCTSTTSCSVCAPGFDLSNGLCVQCPSNCKTCSNGVCSDCQAGYYLSGNSCAAICASTATSNLDSIVTQFSFSAGISYSGSTCSMYKKSPLTATFARGDSVALSVQQGTCGGNYNKRAAVYVDWNGDGSFASTERLIYSSRQSTTLTTNAQVTVPSTARLGTINVRVIVQELTSTATISPCGTYSYGETIDFAITVGSSGPPPNQCTTSADCTPANACQTATCSIGAGSGGQNICTFGAVAACCLSLSDCSPSGDACVATSCNLATNRCETSPVPNCCHSVTDCSPSAIACQEVECSNNFCIPAAICGCCQTNSDCNDNSASTVDECVAGQCYNTPVNCAKQYDGTCWFLADQGQSCTQKCTAEKRVVSETKTRRAGSDGVAGGLSAEQYCMAVATMFNGAAVYKKSSAHARGCTLTANGVVRGTVSTIFNSGCATEQRFCACDSVSASTGNVLPLVGGAFLFLVAGAAGGALISRKAKLPPQKRMLKFTSSGQNLNFNDVPQLEAPNTPLEAADPLTVSLHDTNAETKI